MKFCPNCGAGNPDDAVFCSNCAFRFEGRPLPGQPGYQPSPLQPSYPQPQGQPPYPAPGQQHFQPDYPRYAGFWIRFAASLIDAIVISLIFLPVNVIFRAIDDRIPIYIVSWGFWMLPEGVSVDVLVIFNIVRLAIIWTYFIIMTGHYGATLGKMLLKLKVVREDMGRVSYGTAALRETIGKIISGIVCAIGYIWAGFDYRKQAWHDKIAHTFVIITGP